MNFNSIILKEDLLDTSLPKMIIDKNKLYSEYKEIGSGGEGRVFKYNSSLVLKDFAFLEYYLGETKQKFLKIEKLAKLRDESFCFPIGIFGYSDMKKEGYYTQLVNYNDNYKDFNCIGNNFGNKDIFRCMIKASKSMERIHQLGVALGDIRGENIMIDKDFNPKFVDTDNYSYANYDFDVADCNTEWLSNTFHKKFSMYENDKYVFAILLMKYFVPEISLWLVQSDEFYKKFISLMNVSSEIKDGWRMIFSDSYNKPYPHQVLEKMNCKKKILSNKNIEFLKNNY